MYLDTHVVAWLYANQVALLSDRVRRLVESQEILVSPMVLLELDFLTEIGKISAGGSRIYQNLHTRIGLRICPIEFPRIIDAASLQTWTRDPFDRIIVGHAAASGRDLATRDETIRQHYARAVW
jgi:PIN domain nuclease of toxin-antitoxin system